MGEVIQFPGGEKVKEESPSDFHILIYKWWVKDFFPNFVKAGKVKSSFMVYGELLVSCLELKELGHIGVMETDNAMGLAMEDHVAELIYATVEDALETSRTDKD